MLCLSRSHFLSVYAEPFVPCSTVFDCSVRANNEDFILENCYSNTPSSTCDITVALINCCSLVNKLQLLALYIDTYHCDVLLLTETWLKPDLLCSVVAD